MFRLPTFRLRRAFRRNAPRRSAPRRARVARTSRSRPARRARLLTRRAKLNAARRPRRGVLLLVVLSLLVLFLMVGTAFVITAKQSEKAAKSAMKATVRIAGEAAQADLLDEVLLQIVRDTNNPYSSLRFHSLLGDMYGNDGLKGVVVAGSSAWAGGMASNLTGGQMLEFQVSTAANTLRDLYGNTVDASGAPLAFSNLDNAYNGQVLTFLSGIAKGRSTRIVGFLPPNTFRVMNVQLEDGTIITDPTLLSNAANPTRVLINGRPFSGTGVGFNPWAIDSNTAKVPKLSAQETLTGGLGPFPLALMPNAAFQLTGPATGSSLVNITLPGTPPPSATLPHRDYYFRPTTTAFFDYAGRGGANEGYDAPDFQNMALAYLPATQLIETALPDVSVGTLPSALSLAGATGSSSMVIPSWHRPDLINYWANQSPFASGPDLRGSTLATPPGAALLRRILLRPNWIDHPNFTGSNPEFAAISAGQPGQKLARMVYGPWDVDNDNDGFRDSVWVDVGLPVMAGPNGKLVKPLVAMLITDMDSRANANAAGSCDLAAAWGPAGLTGMPPGSGQRLASPTVTSDLMPHGQGFGPADVSLEQVIGRNDFQTMLVGKTVGGQDVPGRYGHANGTSVRPGSPNTYDLLAQIQFFGWPAKPNVRSSFGTPSDLRARYGLGVNAYGQPAFDATLSKEVSAMNNGQDPGLLMDSPYELNLSQKSAAGVQGYAASGYGNAADAPFSVAEMERLLRPFDADAGALPSRMALLSGVLNTNPQDFAARNKITSDSFDLPTPNISLPHEMAEEQTMYSTDPRFRRPPRTAAELVEMRVRKALNLPPFPLPVTGPNVLKYRNAMRTLVAPELVNGSRLNVNRPIGNGYDDQTAPGNPGYGVVDEPGEEQSTPRPIWQATDATMARASGFNANFPAYATEYPLDPSSPDPNNPNYLPARQVDHRQLLARHLYVLALTTAAEADYDGTRTADKQLAQRIAQWAINVVDFRDADNIMTPFEYDLNPFDGWDVNGWLGDKSPGPDGLVGTNDDVTETPADDAENYRGLVWGAERPELLMTETLAWHDRNTTDEADEDPNQGETQATTTDRPIPDPDFDQLYRPRGAFFLELYNPWPSTLAPSLDTHAANNQGQDYGVNLAAVDQRTGNSGVWRVIVTRDVDPSKDPDDPVKANQPTAIDRSIYFTEKDPGLPDDGVAFFKHPRDPAAPAVRPGRYMVVGSGKEDDNEKGVYVNQLGQRLDQTPSQRPRKPLRRIELDTTNSPHAVRLIDNVTADDAVAQNSQTGTPYRLEAPSEQEAGNIVAPVDGNQGQSVTDVAVINGVGNGDRRRFTLSEPATGYPSRVGNVQFVPFTNARGSKNDPSEEGQYCQGADPNTPKAIDTPLDDGDPELMKLGTDFNRGRRLFLQRLANPLLPHDATTNPYLTVDDTQAYITVFNGRLSSTQQELGDRNTVVRSGFSGVERGYGARNQQADRDLWKTRAQDTQTFTDKDTKRQAINADPIYSLSRIPQTTLGFLNSPYMKAAEGNAVTKRLQPEQPFPWLTWNNRPYVSGNELMLVPRHRSSQLLRYFRSAENPSGAWNQYDPADPDNPKQQLANKNFQPKPFSHLENFFSTEGAAPVAGVPLHLYRMLDLIETPSLFAGTETWLNPANFSTSGGGGTATPLTGATDPRVNLLAPFNRISEFRDPGRINVNTVSERDSAFPTRTVWDGIFHGRTSRSGGSDSKTHPGPALEEWVASRRGYGANTAPAATLNANIPTMFANPLRAADAGDLVPIPGMMRAGVDCTLLRSLSGTAGAAAAPSGEPLFSADMIGNGNDHRNSQRNGFFRYQPMVRLNNLVTNRSNVYAVWITIGFFEVEEAPAYDQFRTDNGGLPDNPEVKALYNRVYPDGYRFGREDGVDVGNTRRLRGFYMIDRTMMAGYEPGADHNVENVVRLRRRIE
ncbi:MAG: hypothetical protein JNL18_03935 [Planctomycetaceae bacterium]|nr:hypothetical protein [Planctomycetaceae bacterium]